jgi:hypothetical protein
MAVIWEATDRFGRLVELTDKGWDHIMDRHEDMEGYQDEIRHAIESADEIYFDGRYPRRNVHYLNSDGPSPPLKVVVNYRPTPSGWVGKVITAFQSERKGKGERQIWP